MTHPDTLTIHRAVVEQALEALDLSYALLESAKSYHYPKVLDAYKTLRAALQAQAAVTTSGPPERDNSKPAEQQGVFRKFNVQRTDGSDQPGGKHHGCEYFVLDVAHDQHAKQALEAYAVACATTHPQLSADMRERYGLQAQAAAEPVTDAPDLPEPVGVVLGFEDDSGMAMVDHASEGGQTLEEKQCVYSGDQMEQRWVQGFLAGKSHTTPPATQAEAEQHTFNDESPFCVKCGSTGEDAEGPVAHILPRDLKILKFKSMPVPVDPLPYDNGEEKTVPLYTSPPATQADWVNYNQGLEDGKAEAREEIAAEIERLKSNHKECVKCLGEALQESTNASVEIERLKLVHDSITVDQLNDRVMRQQAALTAALDYLWVVVEHNRLHFGDSHNTVIQGQAVVAQIEALGVK